MTRLGSPDDLDLRPQPMRTRRERCVLCGIERCYVDAAPRRPYEEETPPRTWQEAAAPIWQEINLQAAGHRYSEELELPIKLGGVFKLVRVRFTVRARRENWRAVNGNPSFDLTTIIQVPDRATDKLIHIRQVRTINYGVDLRDENEVLDLCRRELIEVMRHEVDEGLQTFAGVLFNDPHADDPPEMGRA